ncbi:MAG TPA: amidohydrolase family protein [Leptospiraceae bacterium]|nr:amidohydrolase family protein [Leptospiraceae bacterium]HMW06679.1 amidohydrolase family protein [Leptospiraceae bacterium]HMX34123.1 amidohydrolase family protein [Leptospiraceae bacterium]HMY33600.1 amidohydrolase family protein [Leptospiraceae bacterium]HMZ64925.1 amidohydrolase family protein [Leptospiraceae bacterium]
MQSKILPCCAFTPLGQKKKHITREEIHLRIKKGETVFPWKAEFKEESREYPSHLELLEKYDIPYIIDIHSHFFPEIVMKLIWRWFDSVQWGIAYRYSVDRCIEYLKRNRVYFYTTLNYAHKSNMAEWLNDWIFSNSKNWKGAIPFGTFYPEKGVLSYVRKAVEEYGLRGFKLHCEVSKLDLNRTELEDTFYYLEEKQIPIVIHSGHAPLPGEFTGIEYFSRFMKKFKNLSVIVAHMGAYEISDYAALLDIYPNLKLDTTMVFVDFLATGEDTDEFLPILDRYSEKILFGSDFPNIPYVLSHPIRKLLEAPLSRVTKKNIFYKNAMNLFSL